MRYVSLAYGTREEIVQLLIEARDSTTRSERRRLEAVAALEDLEAGDTSVTFGRTTYQVTEDPDALT